MEKPVVHYSHLIKEETIGSKSCQNCHEDVHPSDPHANAMKSLTEKNEKGSLCVVSCNPRLWDQKQNGIRLQS